MSGCRKFSVTIVSADNLPDIRKSGRMKVWAKFMLDGKLETVRETSVDMDGGTNPRWNESADYMISESSVWAPGLELVVKLYTKRSNIFLNQCIGTVKIPINSLFESGLRSENVLSYSVEDTRNGRLNISYSFGGTAMALVLGPSNQQKKRVTIGRTLGYVSKAVWFVASGDISYLFN